MAQSKPRSATKADATRTRVLEAAARVFRQKGYIGSRLSDIATVAGLQAGSLYYHFDSREALVEEVLRLAEERTRQFVKLRIESLPAGSSKVDRLRTAIAAHGIAVLEISDYTSAAIRIMNQVPEEIRRRRLASQREYERVWDRLLEDARQAHEIRSDVDLYAIRMLIFGALNSAAEWYHPGRGLRGEQLAEQFADVFMHGLSTGRSALAHNPTVDAVYSPGLDRRVRGNGGAEDRGRPRRAATRARILDAAAQVFHDSGYAGTRLTDIASAADLQASSLYYHFASREDLVIELMRIAWERTNDFVRRSVEQLPENSSELDRLQVAMRAHLVSTLEKGTHTAAVVQIMGQVPEEVRRQSLADQRVYIAYWRAILERAGSNHEIRTDLDLSAMLMMLLGALNWTADWYRPSSSLRPDQIASHLATVVIDGLAIRQPASSGGRRSGRS